MSAVAGSSTKTEFGGLVGLAGVEQRLQLLGVELACREPSDMARILKRVKNR